MLCSRNLIVAVLLDTSQIVSSIVNCDVFQMSVSSSDDSVCRVRAHSSVSRRNLAVIVEAIQHLEGDQFYCCGGTEESFEGSQSGDSDGDDPSSVICDNTVGHYACLPDTPEDLSIFHSSRLFLPMSADKNC